MRLCCGPGVPPASAQCTANTEPTSLQVSQPMHISATLQDAQCPHQCPQHAPEARIRTANSSASEIVLPTRPGTCSAAPGHASTAGDAPPPLRLFPYYRVTCSRRCGLLVRALFHLPSTTCFRVLPPTVRSCTRITHRALRYYRCTVHKGDASPSSNATPSIPYPHCDEIPNRTYTCQCHTTDSCTMPNKLYAILLHTLLHLRRCILRRRAGQPPAFTHWDTGKHISGEQVGRSRTGSVLHCRWGRRRTCQPLLQHQVPSYNVTALVLDSYIHSLALHAPYRCCCLRNAYLPQ